MLVSNGESNSDGFMDNANETGGDRCYVLVVLQQQAVAVVVMETAVVVACCLACAQ